MQIDITSLTSCTILLLAVGLDIAGRGNHWTHLRWPWMAVVIGEVFGVKITAPIHAQIVEIGEKVVLIATVVGLAALAVRWLWRRRDRNVAVSSAVSV